MTMREHIARAIYEKRNGDGCVPWGRREAAHKAPYLSDADAVFAAMAEPTIEMIDAGDDPQFGNGPDIVRAIYRAMLAAAGEPE